MSVCVLKPRNGDVDREFGPLLVPPPGGAEEATPPLTLGECNNVEPSPSVPVRGLTAGEKEKLFRGEIDDSVPAGSS